MRFWFEHSSSVSLREQIVAQVTLGILSGELAPGDRLPSIRELSRRFDLHANTVSAGYQQLETEGWVQSRRGSGVYVRGTRPAAAQLTPADALERLVANLFDSARRLHIPEKAVVARVSAWAARPQPARILLVEPDPELRRIVLAELAEAVQLPTEGCGFEECADRLAGSLVVALPSKLERLQANIPGVKIHSLRVRSVPTSLAEHLPPPGQRAGVLVGIASAWPDFLRFARTMLVAAGFDSDALMVRDTREPGWKHGLEQAAAIVCDLVTARQLPGRKTIISRILTEGISQDLL
jgi:GntR family transcriptional regulator